MLINDIILLRNTLKETKVGRMNNDSLRKYLKLSLEMNKYYTEFEEKRKNLVNETVDKLGFDLQTITQEQDREIFNVIAPILDEYLGTDVDLNTKILSWDDLCAGILNVPENDKLSLDDKTRLTDMLCCDEL